ncbi:MAG: hypothetical protein Q9198_010659, partial [Flavoplaca austrocitrina]
FSNKKFREFKRADAHVSKENKATKRVVPIIEGQIADDKCVEGDVLFTNFDPLTDDMLTAAKPDLYYGSRPEQLNRRVREELSGQIIPSKQDHLPLAPNFFLATKGPDGSLAVAGRQASYDGALGARGMHSLQQYKQEEQVYDNNAYTISSIYHGGTLKMYTSHPSQPASPGGRPEYFMTQVKAWAMTSDPETFRKGATAFRNARDWTKEQRDEAIARANEKANAEFPRATAAQPTSLSVVSSFVSEASLEPYTIESLTQESQTSLNEHEGGTPQESETSTDGTRLRSQRAKRSSNRRGRLPQAPRKRRNAGKSSDECDNQGSAFYPFHGVLRPAMRLLSEKSGRGQMVNFNVAKGRRS